MKKGNSLDVNREASTSKLGEQRHKKCPYFLDPTAVKETMLSGLFSIADSTAIRVNVSPGPERIPSFDTPKGNQPQKIVFEILREEITHISPMVINGKLRTEVQKPAEGEQKEMI